MSGHLKRQQRLQVKPSVSQGNFWTKSVGLCWSILCREQIHFYRMLGWKWTERGVSLIKYIDSNELLSLFPGCVAIMNALCSWWCFHCFCIRSDTPRVRPGPSWRDQTPHFIPWHLLRSPCLFPPHLSSLPLASALPSSSLFLPERPGS